MPQKKSKNSTKGTVSKKTVRSIADTQRSVAKQTKVIAKQSQVSAKAAIAARKQAQKSLKIAFKDAKQTRDSLGHFVAKLRRDARGLFVSAKKLVSPSAVVTPKNSARKKSTTSAKKSTTSKSSQRSKQGPASKKPATPSKKPSKIASQSSPIRQNVKREKPSTEKLKHNKIYSVRDFPFAKGESYAEWVNSIDENSAAIDSQLKPGEKFVGLVYGNKTLRVYENIESLTAKLNQYVEEHKGDREELINNIGIITFAGDTGEYQRERDELVRNRKRMSRDTMKAATKIVGATNDEAIQLGGKKAIVKRRKTTIEVLDAFVKRDVEKDKRIAALEVNQARMEAMLATLTKPKAKKKAVKKTAKKAGKK